MKRALIVTALVGALFVGFSTPAEAGHPKRGFHFGVSSHGSSFQFAYRRGHKNGWRHRGRHHHGRRHHGRRHHRHHHTHVRTPIYQKVWHEPVFRRVFTGYNGCGYPTYARVRVSAGYSTSVRVGYHCPPCGYRY